MSADLVMRCFTSLDRLPGRWLLTSALFVLLYLFTTSTFPSAIFSKAPIQNKTMSSNLSATAAAFTLPTRSSANITEPKLIIACRENEEIGTYEDGLLKPRKGVASLIVWKDNAPSTTSIASATNASLSAATPSPFATPLVDPSAHGFSQTTTAGGDAHKFHQDEGMIFNMVRPDYQHQFLSAQVQDFQEENLVRHQPLHPAFAQYNYQTYGSPLPCDVAVSEVNRPVWDPAYHKAVSPSIERANQVVEEFKLYFGDGRAPDLLLSQLQKICLLCGLGETNNLPKTSEECTTVRLTSNILSSSSSH